MPPIQIRVPTATTDRLDDLIPYLSSPALAAAGRRVTRSDVARLAMELGMRALEERRAAGLPPVEAPSP